tara:strand:+ start:2310 stop:2879 length:570 start_codon:yes stop_codon:yes gene_type:complete
MDNEVKKEVIDVLKKSLDSINKDDVKTLRDLSNRIINSSSITQDENVITIAVMTYSLSKIFERTDYRKYPGWNLFHETTINSLKGALFALENNNVINFEKNIKNILDIIDKLDNKLRNYIKEVIHSSQIARGSRLHEHGLSLGRTAELLGIDKWELTEYVSKTGISEVKEGATMTVEKRLRVARRLFNE